MLKFHTVVLTTTNLCNLKCRHCYPASGASPEEIYRFGKNKAMSPEQAERYLRQIPGLENVEKRLHLAGGESTLFKEDFKKIVSLGKQYGLVVTMVTNCSWAKDQEKADEFIADLKERGMVGVQMSMSQFHQEFLNVGYVIRAIRACKKIGMEIVLRPIVTRKMTAASILKDIPVDDLMDVKISSSHCMPIGRAREAVHDDEFFHTDLDYCGCHKILSLTIRQDGAVYPCCAGSDITDALCLGNAEGEPLKDILTRAELDPLLSVLFFQGTKYLAEILRDYGGKDFTKKRYGHICELCNDLFINNEIANQIRAVLQSHLGKAALTNLENTHILLKSS